MPQNKRESLIYTVLMCFFMVVWMTIYNVSIQMGGLSLESIKESWIGVPLAYFVGMCLDWFLVSKLAKGIVFRFFITKESSPRKKMFFIATGMVVFMCFFMSLFGAVQACIHLRMWDRLVITWIMCLPRNFIMAWPLQIFIAGPIVRKIFRTAFPIGSIS